MKGRGVDSKESWIVCLGVTIVFLIVALPMRLGSQLYVSMLDHFEADRKSVSFSFALVYLVRSISGPFAGYFSNKFGLRVVTLYGCLFSIFGVGGCYFAKDIIAVHIFYGLFYGIGLGWATNGGPEIINQHFKKHRSKAYGIVIGSSGLTSFFCPPILEKIFNEYGLSGSFLILSGVLLNSIIGVMLLTKLRPNNEAQTNIKRNVSFLPENEGSTFKKNMKTNESVSFINDKKDFSEVTLLQTVKTICVSEKLLEENIVKRENDSRICKEKYHKYTLNPAQNKSDSTKSPSLYKRDGFTNCNIISNYRFKDIPGDIKHEHLKDNPILLNIRNLNDDFLSNNTNNSENHCKSEKSSASSSLRVLWSPVFLLLSFITSSHFYIMYLSFTITVDVVRDKGVETYQEVYFVMALALSDTIGRSSFGVLVDSGILSRINFCALSFAIMGLLCLVITWAKGFLLTLIAVSLLGLISGGNLTGLPGIVNEFISKENRVMAMSSRLLLYAPMGFTVSPAIGYFRGHLGSYNWLFYVQTILCWFSTVLLLLMSHVKCSKKQSP